MEREIMKRLILTLAAALTLGGGLAATSATAQPGQRTVVRTTTTTRGAVPMRERTVVRTTHTTVRHRRTIWNGRHDYGHHYGWRNHHRTCRTVWRHHRRIRTCRSW